MQYKNLGFFVHGKLNGYGLFADPKLKYEGEWKDNKKNGVGVEVFESRESYSGFFINGEMSLLGTFNSNDQYIYYGEWESNKFHGLVSLFIKIKIIRDILYIKQEVAL